MKNICVFCASSFGTRPIYQQMAEELAQELVKRNLGLIYGGGKVGLMGAIADGILAAGGVVIGVIPEFLVAKEIGHSGLTKLYIVNSMHERKALMAELSDAFIALPGGYGTLEEFCEILTWAQLGLHQKPYGLMNIEGYYDALLQWFDHAVAEEFLKPIHRSLVMESSKPEHLLDLFVSFQPQNVDKWIKPDLKL
ncbi:MAG: TIGR00730 family Rossman fold protein [Leptolyngbyaceae cyanobacterium CRU_2_3]|nr:TIGR00730 family Rossman fold protein [Leptolyngbyaceae cyanobacterium CRU_2_3]